MAAIMRGALPAGKPWSMLIDLERRRAILRSADPLVGGLGADHSQRPEATAAVGEEDSSLLGVAVRLESRDTLAVTTDSR